jgi:hypothetical protein
VGVWLTLLVVDFAAEYSVMLTLPSLLVQHADRKLMATLGRFGQASRRDAWKICWFLTLKERQIDFVMPTDGLMRDSNRAC